jgi:hypothetical protein
MDGRDKPGRDELRDFRQHIVSDCGGFAMIGARAKKSSQIINLKN